VIGQPGRFGLPRLTSTTTGKFTQGRFGAKVAVILRRQEVTATTRMVMRRSVGMLGTLTTRTPLSWTRGSFKEMQHRHSGELSGWGFS